MRGTVLLVALAGVIAVGLFGCGGYETSSGFPAGTNINISGQYLVRSKSPEVLPGFQSLQLTQSGRTVQGIDNLGRRWTGTLSDLGVYDVQQEQEQASQQGQQPTQPTTTEPQSYHGEIYMTSQTPSGTISMTGVIDTRAQVTLPGQDPTQQATSTLASVITATAIDETGASGYINLYSTIFVTEQQNGGTTTGG